MTATVAVDAFARDGYLVLPGVFSPAQISSFRQLRETAMGDWCFVNGVAEAEAPIVVGDLLERDPQAMLKVVANPQFLGLAEAIMGPFVQLDSVVLHASPTRPPTDRGRVVCWHRDRFGSFPVGAYTRPLALICFAYLQEMTADAGPLRVLPGSHREPVEIPSDALAAPHPDEILVNSVPGDVVVIHNNLLHSGTHSVAADTQRQFLGISYTQSCLRARYDNFDGPNCRALLATAHRLHDRRLLRLLGHDDQIAARQNTGFTLPPGGDWDRWRAEDTEYAGQAHAARREVAALWGWEWEQPR